MIGEVSTAHDDALVQLENAKLGLAFAVAEKNIQARHDMYQNDNHVTRLIAHDSLFAKKGFVRGRRPKPRVGGGSVLPALDPVFGLQAFANPDPNYPFASLTWE